VVAKSPVWLGLPLLFGWGYGQKELQRQVISGSLHDFLAVLHGKDRERVMEEEAWLPCLTFGDPPLPDVARNAKTFAERQSQYQLHFLLSFLLLCLIVRDFNTHRLPVSIN